MRHNINGRKLNRTKSHREAMFANMATSLFEHKKLHTTEAKAKELRPFAEALITKAKNALAREKQNSLPEGQTVDIHNRRQVYRVIRNKGVVQELFDAIAPVVESRNGGYTRVTKTGTRRGDAARTAIIELVDWSAPVDGAVSLKRKKKKTSPKSQPVEEKTKKVIDIKDEVAEVKEGVVEVKEEVAEVKEEVAEVKEEVAEVKEEVAEVKEEVAEVKEEVAEVKEEVAEVKEEVAEVKEEVAEVKEEVKEQTNNEEEKQG